MKAAIWFVIPFVALAGRVEAQVRVFVPFVNRDYAQFKTIDQQCAVTRYWESSTSVYNNSGLPGSYRFVRIYGGGDALVIPECSGPRVLAPFSGSAAIRAGNCFQPRVFGPAFIEIEVSPGVIVNNVVERLDFVEGGEVSDFISQGRVSFPIFEELLPAGVEAVCGEVEVFQKLRQACESPNQAYPRRVNVTLFNAGKGIATFTVKVRPLGTSAIIFAGTYNVAGENVVQVNRLLIPTDAFMPNDYSAASARVWVTISSDQPFLAYTSSIFENGEAGSFPMEVFPARVAKP